MTRKDNNTTNHPPRKASHPWKRGATWRIARDRSIEERKTQKDSKP